MWLFWFWVARMNKWTPPTPLSVETPSPRSLLPGSWPVVLYSEPKWSKWPLDWNITKCVPLLWNPSEAKSWAAMGGTTTPALQQGEPIPGQTVVTEATMTFWFHPCLCYAQDTAMVALLPIFSLLLHTPFSSKSSLDIKGNDIKFTAEHYITTCSQDLVQP